MLSLIEFCRSKHHNEATQQKHVSYILQIVPKIKQNKTENGKNGQKLRGKVTFHYISGISHCFQYCYLEKKIGERKGVIENKKQWDRHTSLRYSYP